MATATSAGIPTEDLVSQFMSLAPDIPGAPSYKMIDQQVIVPLAVDSFYEMNFVANTISWTIPYITTQSALVVTTQVNFKPALSAGQILQQWWAPKWATGSDTYTNFIC